MVDERGRIEEVRDFGARYVSVKVRTETIAAEAKPGNFVMTRPSGSTDPLLRRPFGIWRASGPHIWLYFQVLGKGTAALAALRTGEEVDILGPLGNGFPEHREQNILLIAGGRGIVPLFFYAERFSGANSIHLIYGGKGKSDLNLLAEIGSLSLKNTFIFSEDGTRGKKGIATQEVEAIVGDQHIGITFSCGPEPMLRRLAGMLLPLPTADFASLEAFMGCGFGACHSCVVKTVSGSYRRVCVDGPVFPLGDVAWST
jgi:dihydroorotate dehydrogenase electron transfer subunit